MRGTQPRSLGLFWGKGHPRAGVEEIRRLTSAEVQALEDAVPVVRRYIARSAHALQVQTYRMVVDSINALSQLDLGFGPSRNLHSDQVDLSNRLALWLQATRMFLDQTEADIKRRNGQESDYWQEWEGLKNKLHADTFAYRFLYALRNSLHVKPALIEMTLSAQETDRGGVERSVSVRFSREAILSDDAFDAKVARELSDSPRVDPTASD